MSEFSVLVAGRENQQVAGGVERKSAGQWGLQTFPSDGQRGRLRKGDLHGGFWE